MAVTAYDLTVGQTPVQVLNFEPEGRVRVTLGINSYPDNVYVGGSNASVDPVQNGHRLGNTARQFVLSDQDDLYVIFDATGSTPSTNVINVLVETDW